MSDQPPRSHPDMWVDPPDDPRDTEERPRGERAVLAAYLDRYRLTLRMKCEGLDAAQLASRSGPPSSMSLLGLVRHLAMVEHTWSRRVIEARPELPRLFQTPEDHDADFNDAAADEAMVDEAWRAWETEVGHARELYAGLDLDTEIVVHGDTVQARDVIVHLVEEYARHCGHADLLRECIDGRTGQ